MEESKNAETMSQDLARVQPGLNPVRTGRVLASLVALMGMVLLFLERVLAAVMTMASDGVKLGLNRYNNFTGQFAVQNFAEDKKLLELLKEVQELLPAAESALSILFVVALVLLVVAAVVLALPRQSVHVLVAMKILKWESGEPEPKRGSFRETLTIIGEIPLKKLAIPVAVILGLVILGLVIHACQEKVTLGSVDDAIDDMQQRSVAYIEAQKAYFAKNKVMGNAKALHYPDSMSTDAFEYKVTKSRFVSISKVPLGNCPVGTKWSIHSATKGVFDKELLFYRLPPKDTACAKLTPGFKRIGRKN